MLRMKRGYFRVTPLNTYIPLSGSLYYAYENDNVFSIYKDDSIIANYSAASHGIGKIKSVFNTEYIVYEDGLQNIYCIDDDGTSTRLMSSIGTHRSMFCYNNILFVCTRSEGTLTVKKYLIVGAKASPSLEQVGDSTTISVAYNDDLVGASNMGAVRVSDNVFYIYQASFVVSGTTTKQCVKLTITSSVWDATIAYNTYSNTISEIAGFNVTANNYDMMFVNKLDYYANINSAQGTGTTHTIQIYNTAGTLVNTYTIATTTYGASSKGSVKVFFKPNGNGSAYAITSGTNSGPTITIKVYDLTNGTATQLASYTSGTISVVGSSGTQNGFYLYPGRFCGYSFGTLGYSVYKTSITTSSISAGSATNVNTAQSTPFIFGNTIKVAYF